MAHEGAWRIRHMPDDNAPYGRDMHWSQFLLWWLVVLGLIVAFFTGLPLGAAIESAAVWCVVPLHILAIALPLSLRKAFGTGACVLLAFGIGGFYPMASLFFAGQCDHHGIVTAFLLCSILYFCAGCWKSSPNASNSWMIASGVFLGAGLWLASLTLVVACVFPTPCGTLRLKRLEWAAAAVFMLALVIQMPQLMIREALSNWGRQILPNEGDIAVAFARDTAYRLRALSGKEPAVVASGPTTTTWLMYFGGLKGLGTLYWENAEGLKATAALYASETGQAAAQIVKERGVSFIVFLSPEPCENEYPRLHRGLPPGPPLDDTFAMGLTSMGEVPPWAKYIEMPVPANLSNAWAAVYDVRQVGKPAPNFRKE